MRKKLREKAGLTMVEMLAATVVLALLALMLNTGLQMVMNTYQTMIAQSEVELLLSTAVDTLADDLRYAWDVKSGNSILGSCTDFTYNSDSYGKDTQLYLAGGQIIANGKDSSGIKQNYRVLSTGAYGSGENVTYKEYEIRPVAGRTNIVTYDAGTGIFTIHMTVSADDGKISASTPPEGVTVRCLNRGN